MSTAYVDVDGVCADFDVVWLDHYNKDWDDNLTEDKLTEWDMTKFVKPECGENIYAYQEIPSLYDEVEPVRGALEGVGYLRDMGWDVVFVTAATKGNAGRKYDWLVEHEFTQYTRTREDYVEIYNKGLLSHKPGDIMIDDGFHNVKAWPGLGILYNRPHNMKEAWPVRVYGWEDIDALLNEWDDVPPGTHTTELKKPTQTREFHKLMDKMYQVHLNKNQDYSASNILGTGEIGLCTRTWDKMARLMNLMGFKIEISSMRYEVPTEPKNESVDDSIMDAAVYFIIWNLYRKGAWGK